MHQNLEFQAELMKLLPLVSYPRLFIMGRDIGYLADVEKLHKTKLDDILKYHKQQKGHKGNDDHGPLCGYIKRCPPNGEGIHDVEFEERYVNRNSDFHVELEKMLPLVSYSSSFLMGGTLDIWGRWKNCARLNLILYQNTINNSKDTQQ